MFATNTDSKKTKPGVVEPSSHNVIAAGTTLTGTISVEGNIRIDGTLSGSVTTKGKLVLGETGKIEGEVECTNAVIAGELKGKIVVHELLSLKSTSRFEGDVYYSKIEVDQGAKINGTLLLNTGAKHQTSSTTKSTTEKVVLNN